MAKLNCEAEFCIYNRSLECILNNIQLNSFGTCEESIIITLDKKFLETEKELQLQELEEKWTNNNSNTI